MRRTRVVLPFALAVGAAEVAARLLTPRPRALAPDPVDLHTQFTAEEIERGARFARPQLRLSLARAAVDAAALAVLVRRPPRRAFARVPQTASGGAIAAAAMSVALTLPSLPLAVVLRRRAVAVGLVTQSWRGWLADLLKASAIQSVIAAGGGSAAIALTRRYPRSWWVPAATGTTLFGVVFMAVAPVLLDPVFNDFTPLPDGETRTDVLELARAAGVEVGEVYSVDASRRTTAANAYVTGLGPTKRVVLFDTLLDRYTRDEIRVVVAHELGHVSGRDVRRGVLFTAAVAPAGALAVQRLSWWLTNDRATPAALPALALAAGIVSAPIGLIGARVSRAMERRADELSLELTDAPDAFISLELRLARQNVGDLDPPAWVSKVLASHPPTIERIGAATRYARTHPLAAA